MEKIKVEDFIKLNKEELLGKVICFPTDTVYGVGALFGDDVAISKIYKMKNRPFNKPLANLCSSVEQILDLGIEIPVKARDLIDKFWPGALTIIFKHGQTKISFRMPNSEISLKLLDKFSIMTTTSVNESGEKELNSYEEINNQFGNEIDYYISDTVELSKIASTVVDVSDNELKVIRMGSITL